MTIVSEETPPLSKSNSSPPTTKEGSKGKKKKEKKSKKRRRPATEDQEPKATSSTKTSEGPSEKKGSPMRNNNHNKKRKRSQQPLNGVILSVSTLKSVGGGENNGDDSAPKSEDRGYNSVCESCKGLGAQVVSQVSKRVQLLLCTRSAVDKATQRVRKAFKKKIPIVELGWIEACKQAGSREDMTSYRLDEEASRAIENREATIKEQEASAAPEVAPDAGWTEPVSFGCSCVCHENGSQKDCKWCADGCAASPGS